MTTRSPQAPPKAPTKEEKTDTGSECLDDLLLEELMGLTLETKVLEDLILMTSFGRKLDPASNPRLKQYLDHELDEVNREMVEWYLKSFPLLHTFAVAWANAFKSYTSKRVKLAAEALQAMEKLLHRCF